jgi:hypothetical protein
MQAAKASMRIPERGADPCDVLQSELDAEGLEGE